MLAGGESTTKSDIYSIGVLLYHLVTNDYPVRANSLQELREAHAQGRRTHLHDARPELPGGLIQVIERAIEPDAQRRYQTAGEMQAALDRFLASPDDRDSDDLVLDSDAEAAGRAAAPDGTHARAGARRGRRRRVSRARRGHRVADVPSHVARSA